MKKTFKNILKRSAVLALSLSMVVPCIATATVDTYAEGATIIKEYDFEKGLRELYDTDGAYEIISAGGQFVKKTEEQREEGNRVDANGFVVEGTGEEVHYVTEVPGNQPAVKYDDEKGTVFFLAGTNSVPELVKEVSGVVEDDPDAAALLDAQVKIGEVVRQAATFKCAMTLTNPFGKLESDSAVLAFWGKVPANSTEEKIGFIEFNNGTDAVSFAYDSAIERGTWHYYVYAIEKDGIKTYVDGEESTAAPVIDGTTPEDMVAFFKSAKIYFGATNTSSVITVEETVFDDVAFYDGSMTSDELKALYDAAYADFTKAADIVNPLDFYAMDSEEWFTDLDEENPSAVEEFNINGHSVNGVAVVENAKGSTKNGIKLDNPFSGLRIEGATVGYWIQVEPKTKSVEDDKRNSTDPEKYVGKYPGEYILNETVTLSFIDTTKMIANPKHGTEAEGYSYLYTKNRMQAYFEEGGPFAMNTGDLFEVDSSDDAQAYDDADIYIDESRNWHYMTLVINNDGITIYCDGKAVTGLYENQGARFLDGYYRRVGEREKISTLYGTFGGSGNQLTTQILDFLTYEDTSIYFGWLPTTRGDRNEVSLPMNVTRMSFYDMDMSDEEVAALYSNEVSAIEALPEYDEMPDYIPGDVDQDGAVNAVDALLVLKIAAKIEESTETYVMIGDLNDDGALDAQDALSILKIAAKID